MADAHIIEDRPIVTLAQAISQGLTHYFTGKPCKHGHISPRYVNGNGCFLCGAKKVRRWRSDNPERAAECAKRWQQRNPDRVVAARKAYYQANSQACRERARQFRERNPEHARAYWKRYYAANSEKIIEREKAARRANPMPYRQLCKKWCEANRDAVKAAISKRRAFKAGTGGCHTAEQIRRLHVMQRHKCAGCFTLIRGAYHKDHIVPISRGGSDNIQNIQLLCAPCNLRKHAKDPLVWAQENGRLL